MYVNSLSISNSNDLNFGQKIATRKVLALASDRCCYRGNFEDNVRIIKDLATDKSSLIDLTGMGWACTFGAVAKVLLNKYPELKPFADKVKKLNGNNVAKFDESFSKIVEKTEKKLGKEIDISTEDIDLAVGASNSPFSAMINGLL